MWWVVAMVIVMFVSICFAVLCCSVRGFNIGMLIFAVSFALSMLPLMFE